MYKIRQYIFTGLAIVLGIAFMAGADEGNDFSAPQKVWDGFLDSLRTGDMKSAYNLVLPYSRKQMSYRDFCASWHPLSFKYESVLTPPGFSEFCISGDIATLRLGLRQEPGEEKGHISKAALVREDGRWWVVDGPNASNALAEASARNILQRLISGSRLVRESLAGGREIKVEQLRLENPRLFEETSVQDFFAAYTLEVDVLRDGVVRARPGHEGLRGYSVGLDGKVVAFRQVPPKRITGEQVQKKEEAKKQAQAMALQQKQLRLQAQAKARQQELLARKKAEQAAINSRADAMQDNSFSDQSFNKPANLKRNIPASAPVFGDPDKTPAVPLASSRKAVPLPKNTSLDNFDLPDVDDVSAVFSNQRNKRSNTAPVSNPVVKPAENIHQNYDLPDVPEAVGEKSRFDSLKLPEGTVLESKAVRGNSVWEKEVVDVEVPGISAMSIAQEDEQRYNNTSPAEVKPKKPASDDAALLDRILSDFPR